MRTTMEEEHHFISSVSKNAKTVPKDYILHPKIRPEMNAPICKEIPVINLSLAKVSDLDRAKVAEQLLKALDEFSCFQVINHGVQDKLIDDAMEVYKEFFNLSEDEKRKYISEGDNGHKINFWRDSLYHAFYNPVEKCTTTWPEKPTRYRDVVAEYIIQTKKVSQYIFELIAEGLGIEKEHLMGDLKENIRVNYYPKCPDPSLTTGFIFHYDPNMITLLQQNALGLQIHKDGQWLFVETLPNAYFVLTGMELQIISNGRFKAKLHQVATNTKTDRLSMGVFVSVGGEKNIEPSKAFISDENPPKYKNYSFEKYNKMLEMKGQEGVDKSTSEVAKSALDSFLI